MSITSKHLRVIHQEIVDGTHNFNGWRMLTATSTIYDTLNSEDADYAFAAKLATHMLGDQVPEADSINENFHAMKEARGQMLGKKGQASNHDILRNMGIIAYDQASTIEDLKEIEGSEKSLSRIREEDELVQELRNIVVLCIHTIAEAEYKQYARLHERIF